MSELDRVLRKYQRRKNLEANVEWMTRQDASNFLGVSEQRLNQLVKQGRIRCLEKGTRGAINPVRKTDVVAYTRLPKGRHKAILGLIPASQAIKAKHGFRLGEKVVYLHPTEFGYSARVPAKIKRFGQIKILIKAQSAEGEEKELWVHPSLLEEKTKKGENSLLLIKFQNVDSSKCALTICTPHQWKTYLKKWEKVMVEQNYITTHGDKISGKEHFIHFSQQFIVKPISQNIASLLSRHLGGRRFGRLPEYKTQV